ncbi:MAG TPA: alpha/beta fold hydrolase [Candidatus Polarisedimenticolia bacterium]|nr:alpha/beta fold hydrolase [Candidatus Polarisedimenticolia bacterium]
MVRRIAIAIGTLILAVLLWATVRYTAANMETKPLTDEVRKAAGGSYVTLSEGVVHYQIGGPDIGRVVVLVHGFSVPCYIWDPAYEALIGAGIRTLRLDLLGRGYSDRPRLTYSADLFDREIIELLDSLGIQEPVDIAGLSMGGAVAQYFANHHPDRTHSVILIDPSFSHGTDREPWSMHVPVLRNYIMRVHVAPGMAAGQMSDFAYPERFPDWPARYRVQMQYPGFLNAIMSTRLADERRDLSKEYAALGEKHVPVLLIWGKRDRTVPFGLSDELRKLVPQAEFHAIDDAGHIPYMEQPGVVNPILISFLRP